MSGYRTRIFGNQVHWGSGSKINADDIPETLTRVWLTNSLQAISGSKVLSSELNLNSNRITYVTDPVADQDVATKNYIDTASGSCAQSLQGVTNIGNTTTKDITAANLKSNANIYVNNDGPYGDSYIYFHAELGGDEKKGEKGSETASLMFDHSENRFDFDHQLIAVGYKSKSDIYINCDGVAGDFGIYFYHNGSPTGAGIYWWDTGNRLFFDSELWFNADVLIAGDVYFNYLGGNQDAHLYFYKNGATGASLMWDDVPGTFKFSHALDMDSNKITSVTNPTAAQDAVTLNHLTGVVSGSNHPTSSTFTLDDVCENGNITDQDLVGANLIANLNMYINYDGGETDSYLYFYEGGSAGGAYLKWDNGDSRFELSANTYINGICTVLNTLTCGSVHSNANVYVNYNGSNPDSFLYFYEGETSSPTGASLMWDDSEDEFTFNKDITVNNSPVSDKPYGEIYEHNDAGSTITVTTAGTYYGWTTASSGSLNRMTANLLNGEADHIIVQDAGAYFVAASMTIDGEVNATVDGTVCKNGTPQNNLHFHRDMGTAAEEGVASISGLLVCAADDEIDLRFTSDSNGDEVTAIHINLALYHLTA